MLKLPGHTRYAYSPIVERKDYSWPGGKRLAFYVALNIEHFAFGAGLGMDPVRSGQQTTRNFAWRDYGNRIGIWRLFDLLDELQLPAGHNCNSLLYDYAPQIMDAIRKRGDEVVAHGRTNAENLRGLSQPDEERILREVTETISRREGKAPKGWMGAGAYETANTPDLLKELGYAYLMDWPMDDQPVWMRTRSGPILSVPYPIELNDSQVVIHRKQDASDFCDMIVEQFDEMVEQSEGHPLVMNVSIHPYVFGQPFRLRMIRRAFQHCVAHAERERVWWCRPCEISDHCYGLAPGIIPGAGPG